MTNQVEDVPAFDQFENPTPPQAPPPEPVKVEATPKKPTEPRREIALKESGVLAAQTFEQQYRAATVFFKSRTLPPQFDTVEKAVTAMQLCAELGIPAIVGMRQICIIRNTMSLWGDAPLGLVERSGLLESISETVFDKEGNVISPENKNLNAEAFSAVCKVRRKGRDAREFWFTFDEATKAGLLKKDGPWHTYRRRMLQLRARSHALKDVFPDVLMGMAIAEYDHNATMAGDRVISSDPKDVTGSAADDADALNRQFGATKEALQ